MFIVVFLLLGVQGEWVEISQQVFLKPLRHIVQPHKHIIEKNTLKPTIPYKLEETQSSERITKPNRIYINSSLTDYNWNIQPQDSKWIDEDISHIKIRDKVNKNVSADVVKSVIDVKHNNAQIKNSDVKIKSKNNITDSNKTNTSDKRKFVNEVFKSSNKLQRIYFTSSEKPKVVHNTESTFKDDAIEVMNLSDLDFSDADDIVTAANHVKDNKKHATASMPVLKDKPKQIVQQNSTKNIVNEKRNGNLKTNINENTKVNLNTEHTASKLNKRNNTLTSKNQTNRTKTISTTLKTTSVSNTKQSNVIVTTNEAIIQKGTDKSPAKKLPIKAKIQKVHLITTKTTPHEMTVINHEVNKDSKKDNIKTDIKSEVKSDNPKNNSQKIETTSVKPIASTTQTKYQKLLFKPVRKPILPSPDDIMVIELLKEGEKNNLNITSTTKPIYPDIKKRDKIKIIKPSSALTETIQPDEVTKDQIDESNTENFQTDNPNINNDDDDNDDDFEDVIYSNFDTDMDRKDQIPITANVLTSTVKTEPTQDDITEAYVETYEHHYRPVILSESKPEFITKKEIFDENKSTNNNFKTVNENTKTTILNNEKQDFNKPKDDKQNELNVENLNENTESDMKQKDSNNLPNSLENLVRFLKVVTETISRNARRTLKGKTRYLEDLRDTIMANIEQRIEAEFPDDTAPRRSTREARGHVEFPSSESALMSISFLTFAVFLIKLVLQLIYAYKYKTMMTPAVVATISRAYSKFQQRPGDN